MLRRVIQVGTLVVASTITAATAVAQIPGQFAQDFVAGQAPSVEQIASLEKEVAAKPDDFRLVRKLAKGYFFQVVGEGRTSSIAKAQKMFDRALQLKNNDAETVAYQATLVSIVAGRSKDPATQEAEFRRSFELLKKAQELEPNNIGVLSVTGVAYLALPNGLGATPLAARNMEKIRQMMGPVFSRFSHHGQQRILLTQGQAYAKMGLSEKARVCFEEGLKVDQDSVEATLLKAALAKLSLNP